MFGIGYLSRVVTNWDYGNRHKAATIRFFLGTMYKGEAHGDFERQILPADSNILNSALAIFNFYRFRQPDFAKTGGGGGCDVDVMLKPMG